MNTVRERDKNNEKQTAKREKVLATRFIRKLSQHKLLEKIKQEANKTD